MSVKKHSLVWLILLVCLLVVTAVGVKTFAAPASITVGATGDYPTLTAALAAVAVDSTQITVNSDYNNALEVYPVVFPVDKNNLVVDCYNSGATFTADITTNNFLQVSQHAHIQNCNFEDVGVVSVAHTGFELNHNNFVLNGPINFTIGGGKGALIGNNNSQTKDTTILNNTIDIYYGADGSFNASLISGFQDNDSQVNYIQDNVITYHTVFSEKMGSTMFVSGSAIISGNYIQLPSDSADYEWRGIELSGRADDPYTETTTTVEHNTIDMGGLISSNSYGIKFSDQNCYNVTDDANNTEIVLADINSNIISNNQSGSQAILMLLQKNCPNTNFTLNVDYNGFYGGGGSIDTDGDHLGDYFTLNQGENNLDGIDPLFKADSLDLEPYSSYLDVNGSTDIGAYSGDRISTVNIDDNGIVDYINVDANSTDIIQSLRSGDTVNIAAGTYNDGIILNGQDNITIAGAGDTTIINAPEDSNAIYLNNANDNTISNVLAQNATDYSFQYFVAKPNFVAGGHDFPMFMFASNLGMTLISQNDQDVSSFVASFPENLDLSLMWDVSRGGAVGFFTPDQFFASEANARGAFSAAAEDTVTYLEDAVAYADGVYTYNEAGATSAGITITGTPATFYINGVENYFAGINVADSTGNYFEQVNVDNNTYGLKLSGTSDNNFFWGTISTSVTDDILDETTVVAGDGNYLGGVTEALFTGANITGTNVLNWLLAPLVLVTNDSDEPLEGVTVTVANSLDSRSGLTGVDGYTSSTNPIFVRVASMDADGPIDSDFNIDVTGAAIEGYDETTISDVLDSQLMPMTLVMASVGVGESIPPTAFTLSSPLTGTYLTDTTPTFTWTASSDADSGLAKYKLYINDNLVVDNIDDEATTITIDTPLPYAKYSWFIRAVDNNNNYTDSDTYLFAVNMEETTIPAVEMASLGGGEYGGSLPIGLTIDFDTEVGAVQVLLAEGTDFTTTEDWDGEFVSQTIEVGQTLLNLASNAMVLDLDSGLGTNIYLSKPMLIAIAYSGFGDLSDPVVAVQYSDDSTATIPECTTDELPDLNPNNYELAVLEQEGHCYVSDEDNVYIVTRHLTMFIAGEATAVAGHSSSYGTAQDIPFPTNNVVPPPPVVTLPEEKPVVTIPGDTVEQPKAIITPGENNPIFPERRDLTKEKEALQEFISRLKDFPQGTEWSIVHFMAYGTANTQKLTIRQRAGLVENYFTTYKYLPKDSTSWDDLARIYAGIAPTVTAPEKESYATKQFVKIYKRVIDILVPQEKTFVDMIAYQLQPVKRDLTKESAALKVFTSIYKSLPNSSTTWAILRAIAYAGVK